MIANAPDAVLFRLQVHYQAVLPLQRHLAELQREHAALKRAAAEARAAAEMAATKQATGDQQLDLGEVEATARVLESHERSQQVCLGLHCSLARLRPVEAASYGEGMGPTTGLLGQLQAAETPMGISRSGKPSASVVHLGSYCCLGTQQDWTFSKHPEAGEVSAEEFGHRKRAGRRMTKHQSWYTQWSACQPADALRWWLSCPR